MARVGGGGGPRWVWPLIILLILIGMALLAWAFLAPPAPGPQPTGQTSEQPADTPTPSGAVSIGDITADPSSYFGKDVTVEGHITRAVGENGLYIVDRDGGSELMAVLAGKRVADMNVVNDDFVRLSGTIMEVTNDELDKLGNSIDKPTRDAVQNEKAYLSINDIAKIQNP